MSWDALIENSLSWDVLIGGALASLLAVFLVEALLLPIIRRLRLRGTNGTYHVHHIGGGPISGPNRKINYVKLRTKGWYNPVINIEAFDYDTSQSWNAITSFDAIGSHGYGYYQYSNQEDGGSLELFALADGKWACRTHAYHSNNVAIFHWHKQ